MKHNRSEGYAMEDPNSLKYFYMEFETCMN